MNTLKTGGLKERVKDERDFALGAIIKWPKLSDLPKEYWTEPLSIKNQNKDGNDDFCASCASTGMIEPKEEVELFYPFVFAAAKYESGDGVESWGLSLKDVGKALTKWGVPELKDVPEAVLNLTPAQRRDFKNYPDSLKEKAKIHKQKTYFFVEDSPYDAFDEARAAIHYFAEKKQKILLGVQFGWMLSQVELTGTPKGFGHALWCSGWNEKGLVVVNSAGKEAGENGKHYISRESYNYFVGKYGHMMIVDKEREDVEYMLQNNIKLDDSAIQKTIKAILTGILEIAQSIFNIKKKEAEAIKPFISVPTPIIINPKPMEKIQYSNEDRLIEYAQSYLDEDVSQKKLGKDPVKDEFACAESLSLILDDVISFPKIDSTLLLDAKLFMDKKNFARITEPKRGAIVISPRPSDTSPIYGHCGIFITSEKIASNDSKTGKFIGNYTYQEWIKEMKEKRGLRIYLYELLN
jgi:hypothetical protein